MVFYLRFFGQPPIPLYSRLTPVHDPGVEHYIPDVVETEDPCDEPLQAKTIATMWTSAIFPLHGKEEFGD